MKPGGTPLIRADDGGYVFEGGLWDGEDFRIYQDLVIPYGPSFDEEHAPCRHAHSLKVNGTDYSWTIPRVIVQITIDDSTGVCLDCVLDAAKILEELKERGKAELPP